MKTLSEMKSGLHITRDRELFEKTLNDDEIEALEHIGRILQEMWGFYLEGV